YLGLDFRDPRIAVVQSVYVDPDGRRRGVAAALIAEASAAAREHGYDHLGLDVLTSNHAALAVYERLGFVEYQRALAAPLDELDGRLAHRPRGDSHGLVFAQ